MRDDFVELLSREMRDVRWPDAAELRARARRRSRRTAVAAAVSVLALAAGSAVAVSAHSRTAPPASPSGAGATGVPMEALLGGADLPGRPDLELGQSGAHEPVQIDTLLETCAREQGAPVVPVMSRYSRSRSLFQNQAAGESNAAPVPLLAQDLYRIDPGGADRVFSELDRSLASCAAWRQTTPVQRNGRTGQVSIVYSWQVVARDFAGDRAVLLRKTENPAEGEQLIGPEPGETVRVVMQVGDLVTVFGPLYGPVSFTSGELPLITDDQVRDLARTAARRMCSAANPPC
jgi:hypothetical protein